LLDFVNEVNDILELTLDKDPIDLDSATLSKSPTLIFVLLDPITESFLLPFDSSSNLILVTSGMPVLPNPFDCLA
jgi:hypothetical protein